MKPEHRFHSYVTTATVTLMYFVIKYAVPFLHINASLDPYLKPVGVILVSVGAYKALAFFLLAATNQLKFVKRHLLGPSYLNGTWIGKFQASDKSTVYTVEHFEQTLSQLKIRGYAFAQNGTSYASWDSVSATINAEGGSLTYTYNCHKDADKSSFQGLGMFQFERKNETRPPQRIHGFSADLVDGKRTENRERKLSEDLIDISKAFEKAKQM